MKAKIVMYRVQPADVENGPSPNDIEGPYYLCEAHAADSQEDRDAQMKPLIGEDRECVACEEKTACDGCGDRVPEEKVVRYTNMWGDQYIFCKKCDEERS